MLCAAVLALGALLLHSARAPGWTLPDIATRGPSVRAIAPTGTMDAVPRRVVQEARRDGRVFDDLPEPVLLTAVYSVRATLAVAPPRFAPASRPPTDRRICHFRRRIPRMNSEDPPLV